MASLRAARLTATVASLVVACSDFTESPSATDDAGAGADAGADAGVQTETGTGIDAAVAPVLVATSIGPIGKGFAAGSGGLAWVVGNDVWGLASDGQALKLYTSANPLSGYLVVTVNIVLASRSEAVIRCQLGKTCGSGAGTFSLQSPGALAVAGGTLFIAERAGGRRLLTCSASACGASPVAINDLPDNLELLAVSATTVASSYSSGNLIVFSTTVGAAGKSIGIAGGVAGLATDGAQVYWLDRTAQTLVSRPADESSSAVVLVANASAARDLTIEGNSLYWLETDTGTVRRCTKPACTDPSTVTSVAGATRFALGDRVYLAKDSDGTIYAAPKPQ